MPVQRVYFGSTYDLLFGGEAGQAWSDAPEPSKISDPTNDPADASFGRIPVDADTPFNGYAEWKLATIPAGVLISKITLGVWILATGTGGEYDTDLAGIVRPDGVSSGSTGANVYGSPVNLHSHSAAVEIYEEKIIGQWSTNPATSLAWTQSDLASGAFGIKLAMPASGVTNGAIKLGRAWMDIEYDPIDGNVDGVRVIGSSHLRLFRKTPNLVSIQGPALLGDVEQMELFVLEHFLGPTPDGLGWGFKSWSRRILRCLSKDYDFLGGLVTLHCHDPRATWCSWWSTFLTDIGATFDGSGVPHLHSGGGGIAVTRAQEKYVERPGRPPDGLIAQAPADRPGYSNFGLVVEGPDEQNRVLNSTFSQGAGAVLDDWTETESGTGAVGASMDTFQFDVEGLRRVALLGVGASDASEAYISQAFASVATDFRVDVRSLNFSGTGKLALIIRRTSDGKDWNVADAEWQAATVYNRIGNDAGGQRRFFSGLVDMSDGADTITLYIGYFNEAGTANFGAAITSVRLAVNAPTHLGTDIVTTTVAVTREPDVVKIRNDEVGRCLLPSRGSVSFGFSAFWNNADIGSAMKVLLHACFDEPNPGTADFFEVRWNPSNSHMEFRVKAGGVTHTAYVDLTGNEPVRGGLRKVTIRWTSEEGELDLAPYSYQIAVDDVWGVDAVIDPEINNPPSAQPTSVIVVGSNAVNYPEDPADWADGEIRHFEIGTIPYFDEELARRAT